MKLNYMSLFQPVHYIITIDLGSNKCGTDELRGSYFIFFKFDSGVRGVPEAFPLQNGGIFLK